MPDWEPLFNRVTDKTEQGLGLTTLRAGLHIASWGYQSAVILRNWGYNSGLLKTYPFPQAVIISVGNLVVGGTGKTPVTELLGSIFSPTHSVAVLSRGYRASRKRAVAPIPLSHKNSAPFTHGDEPTLLATNLPQVTVYVGADRVASAQMAIEAGAKLLLLDDGLQHRRLARDFDIIVIDGSAPFTQEYFLPRGRLRDNRNALKRASLILVNHASHPNVFSQMEQCIKPYTQAPIVGMIPEIQGIFTLTNEKIDLSQDEKVALFCGIGRPKHFLKSIQELGLEVVKSQFLSDHGSFSTDELISFAKEAEKAGAQRILCTEKDRVKLSGKEVLSLPIGWVKISPKISFQPELWEAFLASVSSKLSLKTTVE